MSHRHTPKMNTIQIKTEGFQPEGNQEKYIELFSNGMYLCCYNKVSEI